MKQRNTSYTNIKSDTESNIFSALTPALNKALTGLWSLSFNAGWLWYASCSTTLLRQRIRSHQAGALPFSLEIKIHDWCFHYEWGCYQCIDGTVFNQYRTKTENVSLNLTVVFISHSSHFSSHRFMIWPWISIVDYRKLRVQSKIPNLEVQIHRIQAIFMIAILDMLLRLQGMEFWFQLIRSPMSSVPVFLLGPSNDRCIKYSNRP